ncbi:MAG: Dam family site-specific DNA-(adenine-N6)-methyltransferase [Bacteroidetes bacterium]|nr:Dam family site-specific DNA-(adenine-N6)-methyltransferase [Bacteroidota bacterium]
MFFLRYPGSKRKYYNSLLEYIPSKESIEGRYIEPFVGSGAIYLFLHPQRAILSDINKELIDLYKGIKRDPLKVWGFFYSFPTGKEAYYNIRDSKYKSACIAYRAARILYLNRTCFKGMWRHNANGKFNVGYGGEERRWAINKKNLGDLSTDLKKSIIYCDDFELILLKANDGDFIFLDPPYKPGEKEMKHAHYSFGKFTFADQVRLANCIKRLSKEKKVCWVMTNSCHPEIRNLYKDFTIKKMKRGVSNKIGVSTGKSKEIIIKNF